MKNLNRRGMKGMKSIQTPKGILWASVLFTILLSACGDDSDNNDEFVVQSTAQDSPLITFSSIDETEKFRFDATSRELSMSVTLLTISFQPDEQGLRIEHTPESVPMLSIQAILGENIEGTLEIVGAVTDNLNPAKPRYSGLLLSGHIININAVKLGQTISGIDFIIQPIGGSMASLYNNKDIRVAINLSDSTFQDRFDIDFEGLPYGELSVADF